MLTPQDRAASYITAFAQFPASHPVVVGRWLQAVWVLGNDYKGSGYYGAFPPGLLKRIMALFPDAPRPLHLFSGSLPPGAYTRLDCQGSADVRADATQLPFMEGAFGLVIADPPYTQADATRYGTPMVNRRAVLREVARVVKPGGHLVWLDTVLPMFRKTDWNWWGAIAVVRSTNHRVRLLSLFRRT